MTYDHDGLYRIVYTVVYISYTDDYIYRAGDQQVDIWCVVLVLSSVALQNLLFSVKQDAS